MIKKLLTIEKFGVFNNFRWSDNSKLYSFNEKNIIYGWNYSGKTTVSRIFSSLRDKNIHADFNEAKFKLQLNDNIVFESKYLENFKTPVIVFNKEYIDSKLTWDLKPYLGEPISFDVGENVTIRKEIEDLDKKIEDIKSKKIDIQKKIGEFAKYEKSRFTTESKLIRSTVYNDTKSFDLRHFKKILGSITKDKLDDSIIKESKIIEKLKVSSSRMTNNFEEINKIEVRPELNDLKSKVRTLLLNEPPKDLLIGILDKNKNLYDWVKRGLGFKENEKTCSFCGSKVTANRITYLNSYFSNASKILRDSISEVRKLIIEEIEDIKSIKISSKNDFTEKFRETIDEKLKSFPKIKSEYISGLKSLLKELDRKEDANIFNSIKFKEDKYDLKDFKIWFKEVNETIESHNSSISNFEKNRESDRETLKTHLVADFIKREKYFVKKEESERNQKCIKKYSECIPKKETLRKEKIDSLKSITKGKSKLNKYIKKFLNQENIEIRVTKDDKFNLFRKDKPAYNLSEGEKTAIAFSYFLVDLESQGTSEMQKTIVFIDDPISSLDTNHISYVYSLINSFFFRKNIDPKNPEAIVNCFRQLFISTHNFEFFSFLKDSKRLKNSGLYLIQRTNTSNSTLKDLPEPLKRYNSEYIYLFKLIYDYNEKCKNGNNEYDILIPNALRRFLEIYSLIKVPNEPHSFEERIKHLEGGVNFLKTLNHLSHFRSFERLTKHDEITMNLPDVCSELFKFLMLDKKYYELLKKSIT